MALRESETKQRTLSCEPIAMSNGIVADVPSKELKLTTSEWLISLIKLLEKQSAINPLREQPVVNFNHPTELQVSPVW